MLNVPTDAERFPLGSLSCSGLLVFGIVFGCWGSGTKKNTQIFFLDYPRRFHKWMLDYPVICRGTNQAANGCSTNLEGKFPYFHSRRDVRVGVIFYGSRRNWRFFGYLVNVGLLSCFNGFFPFFCFGTSNFSKGAVFCCFCRITLTKTQ